MLSVFFLRNGILSFNAEIDTKIQEQEKIIDGVAHQLLINLYNPYLDKIKIFGSNQFYVGFAKLNKVQLDDEQYMVI